MPVASLVVLALLSGPARYAAPSDPATRGDLVRAVNARLAVGVTPETNALVGLWGVFGPRPEGGRGMPAGYFPVLGAPAPPDKGDYLPLFSAFVRSKFEDADEQNRVFDVTARPWKPADLPAVAEWLTAHARELDAARVAVARPGYFNPLVPALGDDGKPGPLVGVLLPHVQAYRELAAALRGRAMLRAGTGDTAGAWADIVALFRLGRHVGSGSTMIEHLVGLAVYSMASDASVRFVAAANLTPAELAACRRDLDGLAPPAGLARTLDVVERAMAHDGLRIARQAGDPSGLDVFAARRPKPPDPRVAAAWNKLDWSPAEALIDRHFDRLAAALRAPDLFARSEALDRAEDDLRGLRLTNGRATYFALRAATGSAGRVVVRVTGDRVLSLMAPAIVKVAQASERSRQTHVNVRVAFALAAFKLDRGNYPAELAELVPGYLPTIVPDVFTGRPPEYTRTADGYELVTAPPPNDPLLNRGVYRGVRVPAKDGE